MQKRKDFVKEVFSNTLIKTGNRIAPGKKSNNIRLNRNESAFDISNDVKHEILMSVKEEQWKNYPTPYYNNIEGLIANYCKVQKEQVATAAGSANIITALLNYFAINKRQIVLAQPSFNLYEYHCNTYGIHYELWKLNRNLEYDIELLPALKPVSLVLFASPNNPVGNIIEPNHLEALLKLYPETLFVVDEVYSDYSDITLTHLINDYTNIVLLRSFSKSFSAAGLRVGFMIGSEDIINNLRKLILPFSLNYLSKNFVETVLSNGDCIKENNNNICYIKAERQRVYEQLTTIGTRNGQFSLKPSFGNFLLIKFIDEYLLKECSRKLEENGYDVLDVSSAPMLDNSLRLTIGLRRDNDKVVSVLNNL